MIKKSKVSRTRKISVQNPKDFRFINFSHHRSMSQNSLNNQEIKVDHQKYILNSPTASKGSLKRKIKRNLKQMRWPILWEIKSANSTQKQKRMTKKKTQAKITTPQSLTIRKTMFQTTISKLLWKLTEKKPDLLFKTSPLQWPTKRRKPIANSLSLKKIDFLHLELCKKVDLIITQAWEE